MKTVFCIILFVTSVFCVPSELLKEDKDEKKIDINLESSTSPAITTHEMKSNILPVYETKMMHSSHTMKSCSPHCHLEIFEKPLYLVMRSDALSEPEKVYLKDGLKSFKPSDKLKLTDASYNVVVFTKNDFPINSFPRVIDAKTTELEMVNPNIPYVVIMDHKNFAEINRNEKYHKVAEIEVTNDGLIKGLKMIKLIKIDDNVKEELKGRTIGTTYKLIPVDENLPLSSYYDTLKMMKKDKNIIRVDDIPRIPLEDVIVHKYVPHSLYPKIDSVETQEEMRDDDEGLLKAYLLQVMHSKMHPTKSDQLYLDNSKIFDKVPIVDPISKYETKIINYLRNRELNRMDYIPKEFESKYNVDYIPKKKPVLNVDVSPLHQEYSKVWENKYAPYHSKYMSRPVSDYNKLPNLNSEMESTVMTSDYIMKPHNAYEMYQNPHHYYGPNVMRPIYSPGKVPYHPMYNQYPFGNPMPFMHNHPQINPGIMYVLNLCQDHKPVTLPVEPVSVDHEKVPVIVETHPVEEHKKPESIVIVKPIETPNHSESIKVSNLESPASIIHKDYEPDFSFRTIIDSPEFIDSDEPRKIFIYKKPLSRPHPESHPTTAKPPSFAPPELPPIHDLRRPSHKSFPVGFFPIRK